MRLAVVIAFTAAAGGCYKPDVASCQYACAADTAQSCPSGLTCIGGMCSTGETCDGSTDGGGSDGGSGSDACTNGWCPEAVAGVTTTLNAVWGPNANEQWAVGDSGVVLHYSQGAWSKVSVDATATTWRAVTGTSATDVWIVGGVGKAVHLGANNQWLSVPTGSGGALTGVAIDPMTHDTVAVALTQSFRITPGGTAGASWVTLEQPAGNPAFTGVAFGLDGRWLATTKASVVSLPTSTVMWTADALAMEMGSPISTGAAIAAIPGHVFAVADSAIFHGSMNTGVESWGQGPELTATPNPMFDAVAITPAGGDGSAPVGDVWAVGDTIAHRSGTTWGIDTFVPPHTLRGVTVAGTAVIAVGDNGTIFRHR